MYRDISHLTNRVVEDPLSAFLRSLQIQSTGFGKWTQTDTAALDNFMIADFELICVVQGSTQLLSDGTELELRAGETALILPFRSYSAHCLPGSGTVYFYFHFDLDSYAYEEQFQRIFGAGRVCSLMGATREQLETLREGQCAGRPGTALEIDCTLLKLLAGMALQEAEQPARRPYRKRELEIVEETMRRFRERLSEPIDLGGLADEMGVTRSYLYKCFHSVLGRSPEKALMQYKIKESARLMRTGNYTQEQLAERLGFSSAFHFSKAFKQVLGKSPGNYFGRK